MSPADVAALQLLAVALLPFIIAAFLLWVLARFASPLWALPAMIAGFILSGLLFGPDLAHAVSLLTGTFTVH